MLAVCDKICQKDFIGIFFPFLSDFFLAISKNTNYSKTNHHQKSCHLTTEDFSYA